MISLSVVVPVYAGEKYLRDLVEKIAAVREKLVQSAFPIHLQEIVFVDDSAIDGSPAVLDQIALEESWVKVVHLARNFGQHAATIAGIINTTGDWVVTMDEDLQHPPSRIPDLLRKVAETQCDIVYASATSGVHSSLMRDLSSRSYKRMMEWLTGNPHLRHVNSFRLIRGSIARGAAAACPNDIYFDVMLSWFTNRVKTVFMDLRDERFITTGSSGYNLRSLMSHARRMLASSQVKMLRLGAAFGMLILLMSLVAAAGLFLMKVFAPDEIAIQGWASQVLLTTFFGGLCVFMIGVVLEYISIMLVRSHGKPLFFAVDRSSDAQLKSHFEAQGTVEAVVTP